MVKTRLNKTMVAVFALAVVLGASGCASEDPGPQSGLQSQQSPEADKANEAQSHPGRGEIETPKNTTLPSGFAADTVALPDDLDIVDAGERGDGVWYLTLNFADTEAAEAAVDLMVVESGAALLSTDETVEGGKVWVIAGSGFEVTAVTLPQAASTWLTYDIVISY